MVLIWFNPHLSGVFFMSRKSHLNWGYLRCRQLYRSSAKSKNEVSVPVTMGLLVGGKTAPLKNMSSSVGMMKFPIYGKITNVPNHQPGLISIVPLH